MRNNVIYSTVVLRILHYHALMSLRQMAHFQSIETSAIGCAPQNFINPDVLSSDINECEPTSDCMHQCNNTEGSYHCYCNEFFKVNPNDPKNCTRKF